MIKIKNRYQILCIACLIQFCYGISYVWTVIQPYAVTYFKVSQGEASKAFAILMVFFVLGNILGGHLNKKLSSKVLLLTGSFVMSISIIGCTFVNEASFYIILLLFGCFNGVGCGVAYNVLLSEMQNVFSDRKGIATGLLISSAGLFGLIMNPLQSLFIQRFGVSNSFMYLGLIILVITCGGTCLLSFPKKTKAVEDSIRTPSLLKQKEYYYLSLTMMVAVPIYFLVNPIMLSMSLENNISYTLALRGIMAASIMNVLGRLLIPILADVIGSRKMLLIMFLCNIILLLGLILLKGYVLLILFSFISFIYGGIMGVFPVINIEFFGQKNNGWNYGLILIGYGGISILCPYLKSLFEGSNQSNEIVFMVSILLSFFGLFTVKFLLNNKKLNRVEGRGD